MLAFCGVARLASRRPCSRAQRLLHRLEGEATMTAPSEAEPSRASILRRATLAAAIGNTVENYDYAVYGFVAAVLAKNFFPHATPGAALLSTFAVFGAAFVVRPLGGLLLGPMAD